MKDKKIKQKRQWKTFKDAEQAVHTINLNFQRNQINIIFDVIVEGTTVNRDEKILNCDNIVPENFIGNEKVEELLEKGLAENNDKIVEMAKKRLEGTKYNKKELNKEITICKKLAKINLYHDLKRKTMSELMHTAINNKGIEKIIKAM